jgi:hypothetical protein
VDIISRSNVNIRIGLGDVKFAAMDFDGAAIICRFTFLGGCIYKHGTGRANGTARIRFFF